MKPTYSTLIPNMVFDDYLPSLKLNELKVLLIVLRQTVGFRKSKDWISSKQMELKTGLSRRSISHAITSLIDKQLISTTDDCGNPLNKSIERKGRQRIFYASRLPRTENNDHSYRKNFQNSAQNLRTTKNYSYKNSTAKKMPNYEIVDDGKGNRYARQIL